MARELDLYGITEDPISLRDNLIRMRNDFDNHIHDGTSSRTFQTLIAETVSARVLAVRKNSFVDTTAGLWTGLVGNQPKFYLGNATDYFKFDENGIAISLSTGSFIISQLIASSTLRFNTNGLLFFVSTTENASIRLSSGSSPISAGVQMSFNVGGTGVGGSDLHFEYTGSNTSVLKPGSGDTVDLGNASDFFNDINYKTLTDRGCLGYFDGGVILRDGRKVRDTEAIKSIQKHPTKKTIYGVEMLDYETMPASVFRPAPIAERNIYKKDKNGKDTKEILFYKGEKMGQDGAETTALISIMLGSIKELTLRVEELEKLHGVIPKEV